MQSESHQGESQEQGGAQTTAEKSEMTYPEAIALKNQIIREISNCRTNADVDAIVRARGFDIAKITRVEPVFRIHMEN